MTLEAASMGEQQGPGPTAGPVRLDLEVSGRRLVAHTRPLVMGVLNVTPDSFSDGGRYLETKHAVRRAFEIQEEGADLLDLGGESTRPGARPVGVAEEKKRVLGVIEALTEAGYGLPLCVDTRRAGVAQAALDAGAGMINDVSALADDKMGPLVAERGVGVVLMHMKGEPATMQEAPGYEDVVAEVIAFLADARDRAIAAGIARRRIIVDPGIGFGKRTGAGVEDNLSLLAALPRLGALGQPILVGASRKRFIGNLTGAAVDERLPGSLVAAMAALWGGASILRVHDVAATVQAVRLAAHMDPSLWRTFGSKT